MTRATFWLLSPCEVFSLLLLQPPEAEPAGLFQGGGLLVTVRHDDGSFEQQAYAGCQRRIDAEPFANKPLQFMLVGGNQAPYRVARVAKFGAGIDEVAAVEIVPTKPLGKAVEQSLRPFGLRSAGADPVLDQGEESPIVGGQDRFNQGVHGGKVAIEGALGAACLAPDTIDAGGMKAVAVEESVGGVEQLLALVAHDDPS